MIVHHRSLITLKKTKQELGAELNSCWIFFSVHLYTGLNMNIYIPTNI